MWTLEDHNVPPVVPVDPDGHKTPANQLPENARYAARSHGFCEPGFVEISGDLGIRRTAPSFRRRPFDQCVNRGFLCPLFSLPLPSCGHLSLLIKEVRRKRYLELPVQHLALALGEPREKLLARAEE